MVRFETILIIGTVALYFGIAAYDTWVFGERGARLLTLVGSIDATESNLAAVHEHHLESRLLHRLIRAARRAFEPPLDVLDADRVLRAGLSDLDVEYGERADTLKPDVLAKDLDSQTDRLEQALSIDSAAVPNPAMILERHLTDPYRHGRESRDIRVLFANGPQSTRVMSGVGRVHQRFRSDQQKAVRRKKTTSPYRVIWPFLLDRSWERKV